MKIVYSLILVFFGQICFAQNNRVNDNNNINWVQVFINKKMSAKVDAHLEYQWRRTNGFKDGQQGLLRAIVIYKPNEQSSFGLGYAEVETYPYGDFPIAANGRFPEHRIFEQWILKQKVNKVTVTNRFRVEQRWLGRVKAGTNREIEGWTFLHRFRYLLRVQTILHKNVYGWVGNEIFIGAGKNLGVNIFDQNRLHLNVGFKCSAKVNVELGYLNQIVQQGRLVNTKSIMQRNNGCTISTYINL